MSFVVCVLAISNIKPAPSLIDHSRQVFYPPVDSSQHVVCFSSYLTHRCLSFRRWVQSAVGTVTVSTERHRHPPYCRPANLYCVVLAPLDSSGDVSRHSHRRVARRNSLVALEGYTKLC